MDDERKWTSGRLGGGVNGCDGANEKEERKTERERRRDKEWTIEHHSKVVSNWMEREIQCALPIHNANKVFFLLISVWLVCFPFWPHVSRFYFIYLVLFFATLPPSLPPIQLFCFIEISFFSFGFCAYCFLWSLCFYWAERVSDQMRVLRAWIFGRGTMYDMSNFMGRIWIGFDIACTLKSVEHIIERECIAMRIDEWEQMGNRGGDGDRERTLRISHTAEQRSTSYQQPSISRISIRISFFIGIEYTANIVPTIQDIQPINMALYGTFYTPWIRNRKIQTHSHTHIIPLLVPSPHSAHWIALSLSPSFVCYIIHRNMCMCIFIYPSIDVLLWCRY